MKIKSINSCLNFTAKKIPKKQAEYINRRLLSSNSVDIFCHIATDEDSFNSAKIMYEYLEANGVKPRIFCNNSMKNYGYDKNKYNIYDLSENPEPKEIAQTALCLDFSDPVRIRGNDLNYLNRFNKNSILLMDHHSPTDSTVTDNEITTSEKGKIPQNGYIDPTAKSAASILVRFFNTLNINMSDSQYESAFCAMVDDMNKANLISISNGEIIKSEKLIKDKNADEVFNIVSSHISDDKKKEIISHLDVLTKLSEPEKIFRQNLYNNIMFSENKKFAYTIIAPDDNNWRELGGDNPITSKILRDFRVRILEHKKTDNFINEDLLKDLQQVEAAAVFYPDYKTNRYKMSIHSNKDYALKIIDYNKTHYNKDLTAGGHPQRAGGSIPTLDKKECSKWINDFILSAQNIQYS